MNVLESKLKQFAENTPEKIAIQGDSITLTYQQLQSEVSHVAEFFGLTESMGVNTSYKCETYAMLMDNHPAWAVIDLALLFGQQCNVPLPHFFSSKQLKHSLLDSNADILILDESYLGTETLDELNKLSVSRESIIVSGKKLILLRMKARGKCAYTHKNSSFSDKSPVKITYTSGTTDKPKGVLLSEDVIMSKLVSLATASEANQNDISLSILPLSTLLENIAGLYVPLYSGATVILLSSKSIGLSGSSKINHNQLLHIINQYQPTAFIIIPQLLLLFVNAISNGYQLPESLRFVALGGAPISVKVLEMAYELKIPVYEGYGLSEAASVVSVNGPSHHRVGSVGQVLDSHQVKINEEGEILIKNALFNGYLGQNNHQEDDFYATGDMGYFDDDHYLYITGRKKNIINTSFGRNISPEWIEKELEAIPIISQCLVYGHGMPNLVALLVLRGADRKIKFNDTDEVTLEVRKLIDTLNLTLPDYARIADFILLDTPFRISNSQLTGTGRPRRKMIYLTYKEQLAQCYDKKYHEKLTQKKKVVENMSE